MKTGARLVPVLLFLPWLVPSTLAGPLGPYQIDFNVPGYASSHVPSVTKNTPIPAVSLTVRSLNASLKPAGKLWWDRVDGFGVCDLADSTTYEVDEIEGNDVLEVAFSREVNLLSFNVTDFYNETASETATHENPGRAMCPGGNCYLERGQYSLDGGLTWIPFHAGADQTRSTYGVLLVGMDEWTTSLLLKGYGFEGMCHSEFSLAGVKIRTFEEVPEPATLGLLGVGALALVAFRRRRS